MEHCPFSLKSFLFLLLLHLHLRYSHSVQLCFSSNCAENHEVCARVCENDSDLCQAIKLSESSYFLSCVPRSSDDNVSTECIPTLNNPCKCSGRLCNRVESLTTPLENVLGIHDISPSLSPPTQAPGKTSSSWEWANEACYWELLWSYRLHNFLPSTPLLGTIVCETNNCSLGLDPCFHGYTLCSSYCQSFYVEVTSTQQISLFRKSCLDSIDAKCNVTDCHVDNELGTDQTVSMCCCNTSFCNENETFTHPTQHVLYGE